MKATLEFNLPEDQVDFDLVVQASDLYAALWDIYTWSRQETVPEVARAAVSQIIQDHNIVL